MKKLPIVFILIFCIFLCGCVKKPQTSLDEIKERGNLIVGVKFDAKPFGYVENGELQGIDIDIAREIAKNIFDDESKVEFIEVTSENRISKLMSGEIDIIIATMTDTPERRLIVDFSDPYYISGQAILCKKDSDVTSVADLKNHNTIVVIGTTAEKTLRKFYIRSNVIRALNYEEAFAAVNKDSCLIADEALLQGFVIDNQGYQIFNKKLSQEPYAVAVRKDEPELKHEVDYTIKYLETSEKLDKIRKKHLQ